MFENRFDEPIIFILEPGEVRYEISPLARIGVRYSFEAGIVDRTFAYMGERTIEFWCHSDDREVEIVEPNAFDLLLRDICVMGGYCGRPTVHVTDLLPSKGFVTAAEFATLVVEAEGGGGNESWLASKFVERMGSSCVPAEILVQTLDNPFDVD
ncbi:hypothetical protein N6H05_19670 [Sphingobium sp. WTD-1]|uniref:hypothetical protein n=1 Tax=Sphingobium sp. WTD-1 TaxID=2979467 RepID=UPI0024DECABF|nr:hypothetical protein [Sphingobium sp. WTD-1]WIA55229.1 hypothetical protein N6H05_19670 [Sphingobium sp. WTD-1]